MYKLIVVGLFVFGLTFGCSCNMADEFYSFDYLKKLADAGADYQDDYSCGRIYTHYANEGVGCLYSGGTRWQLFWTDKDWWSFVEEHERSKDDPDYYNFRWIIVRNDRAFFLIFVKDRYVKVWDQITQQEADAICGRMYKRMTNWKLH